VNLTVEQRDRYRIEERRNGGGLRGNHVATAQPIVSDGDAIELDDGIPVGRLRPTAAAVGVRCEMSTDKNNGCFAPRRSGKGDYMVAIPPRDRERPIAAPFE